ncbi:MAG: hypothetical protein JOZ78_25860 [Chroococcidiopsidaceae cyanobacterium CP_BM_ER_R8_30]|nr:hypothetical protein [Chroococcidiopsidaceae cyanobacterium CP_BM_ER_R8_30]
MKSKHIKRKQIGSQDLSHGKSQRPDITARWLAHQPIKCVSPMTFSQKMYQPNLCEIAAESEQAIEANSLEEIRKQLDKVLELGD